MDINKIIETIQQKQDEGYTGSIKINLCQGNISTRVNFEYSEKLDTEN